VSTKGFIACNHTKASPLPADSEGHAVNVFTAPFDKILSTVQKERTHYIMAVPITVVDDSKISRKMVIRALPSSWKVDITQAENGVEALAAYRDGKAEIMFLDLTMPVMDGYETLEHLQKEALNTFVIVISADIQPEAQERVKKLGAMAFIKKPVKTTDIENVLREYGII